MSLENRCLTPRGSIFLFRQFFMTLAKPYDLIVLLVLRPAWKNVNKTHYDVTFWSVLRQSKCVIKTHYDVSFSSVLRLSKSINETHYDVTFDQFKTVEVRYQNSLRRQFFVSLKIVEEH